MTANYPYYDPYYDPYAGYAPPPPAPAPRRTGPRALLTGGIAAVAAACIVGGVVAAQTSDTVSGTGALGQFAPSNPGSQNGQNPLNPGELIPGSNGSSGNGSSGSTSSASIATAAQKSGIVTVVSVLQYQNAESAGTGLVLSSDGEILTNNHVINGATSVTVTIASTGKSYRADVVGTDPTDDLAVVQLRNASGLTTANLGDSSGVSVGDAVTGVGNAGGTGTLRASSGKITALNRSITATDNGGQDPEKLSGLVQTDAQIISGDSGGPLYDSAGKVIGIDTAASLNQAATESAYAIPIDKALGIADQIESGNETSKIHIGLPAFLGVGLDPQITSSATVSSALPGGPAAGAGIAAGAVITGVDGTHIGNAASLKPALQKYQPGAKVSITWTDASGSSHTATVTLARGPAD
jgi:S1-C subfamily serine protease